jgi:hypothetical protein
MFVEVVDQLDEGVPVRDGIGCVSEELVIVGGGRGVVGNPPDLEEAAVVREDLAGVVDDENALDGRLLLGLEDGDGGLEGIAGRRPSPPQ